MISLLTELFDVVTDVNLCDFLPLLIGGLLGFGGAAISANSQQQTNEMSQEMMYEQRQWALDDYDKKLSDTKAMIADQRNYESPANQMKLARDAGVNPLSVLGTASSPGVNLPDISQTPAARLAPPITPSTVLPLQSVASDFLREELASKKAATEGQEIANAAARQELDDLPLAIEHRKEKRSYERRMWKLEESITEHLEKIQRVTADNAQEITSLTIKNLQNMVTLGDQSVERGIITNSRFSEQLDLTLSNLRQDIEDKIFYRKNAAEETSIHRQDVMYNRMGDIEDFLVENKNADTQRTSAEGNLKLREEEIKVKKEALDVEWKRFEEAVKMNNWSIARDCFDRLMKIASTAATLAAIG